MLTKGQVLRKALCMQGDFSNTAGGHYRDRQSHLQMRIGGVASWSNLASTEPLGQSQYSLQVGLTLNSIFLKEITMAQRKEKQDSGAFSFASSKCLPCTQCWPGAGVGSYQCPVVFSDFTMVAWNWPLWECLHYGNWQILPMETFFFFNPQTMWVSGQWILFCSLFHFYSLLPWGK